MLKMKKITLFLKFKFDSNLKESKNSSVWIENFKLGSGTYTYLGTYMLCWHQFRYVSIVAPVMYAGMSYVHM
jgi:hypothetical protein